MYEAAKTDYQLAIKNAQEEAEKFWREKKVELERCSADIAYKTRNPSNCSLPLMWQSIGKVDSSQTVEAFYERRILGICAYVPTVAKAREMDCLPR